MRVNFEYSKTKWVAEDYTKAYEIETGTTNLRFPEFAPPATAHAVAPVQQQPDLNMLLEDFSATLARLTQ